MGLGGTGARGGTARTASSEGGAAKSCRAPQTERRQPAGRRRDSWQARGQRLRAPHGRQLRPEQARGRCRPTPRPEPSSAAARRPRRMTATPPARRRPAPPRGRRGHGLRAQDIPRAREAPAPGRPRADLHADWRGREPTHRASSTAPARARAVRCCGGPAAPPCRAVPSGTHGSRPHEARRRCAREGMRHPGPVRHPAPEARRRRDTSEAPGGIHTLGRSAARRRAAPKLHHPALAKRTLGSPAREHSISRHSGGSLMHARSHAAIRMLVRCVVVAPHAILRYMPKFSQLLDNCEEDAGRRAHRRRTRKQTLRVVIDACPITCRNPQARAARGCRTVCDSPLHAKVLAVARQLRGRCRAPSAPAPHAKADAAGGH